jgi:hypothetical protein
MKSYLFFREIQEYLNSLQVMKKKKKYLQKHFATYLIHSILTKNFFKVSNFKYKYKC